MLMLMLILTRSYSLPSSTVQPASHTHLSFKEDQSHWSTATVSPLPGTATQYHPPTQTASPKPPSPLNPKTIQSTAKPTRKLQNQLSQTLCYSLPGITIPKISESLYHGIEVEWAVSLQEVAAAAVLVAVGLSLFLISLVRAA